MNKSAPEEIVSRLIEDGSEDIDFPSPKKWNFSDWVYDQNYEDEEEFYRLLDDVVYETESVHLDTGTYLVANGEKYGQPGYVLINSNFAGDSLQFDSLEDLERFVTYHEYRRGAFIDADRHIYQWDEPDVKEYTIDQKREHLVYESGGYIFLKLPTDPEFIRAEGKKMSHCLSVAHHDYCQRMEAKEIEVYSQTDAQTGNPVVDIEVALLKPSYNKAVDRPTVTQIRGVRNQVPPKDEYLPALMDFFKHYGQKQGWAIWGHGVRNFDGVVDGDALLKRWEELQAKSGEG